MLGLHPAGGGNGMLPFADRDEAGRLLAERLVAHRGMGTLVLGIPRGGVVLAGIVAEALDGELDVIVARKLGAPHQPELALGAITADGTEYINTDTVEQLGVPSGYIASVARTERAEAQRREEKFRGSRSLPKVEGRTVIVVDDGLATGATMFAAVEALKRQNPKRLIVAVPVGASSSCAALRRIADEVVCMAEPTPFYAVGMHYRDFPQVEDAEVVEVLETARARHARSPSP